jgi:gliding motility-associated-like protein
MVKPLLQYLTIIFLVFFFSKAFSQFPYKESFTNRTANGVVFGGAPAAFLTASGGSSTGGLPVDSTGAGFLRLTNATNNQKGYAYGTSDFPSSNGLRVEFEYYIYGGSGADGISFFLFDASADPFVIGGFGGSLGYAQITTTNPVSPGVSKGYLGIGLDEFGNFSNANEGRQGGTAQIPGSVTLRGRGNGNAQTADNYRFLITKQTDALGVPLVGDPTKRVTSSSQSGYRKVSIELIPNANGGYNVNVNITKGGNPQVTTKVISNYYYPDAAPAALRYGFASSTGAQTNFHEIRNLTIDLYNPAAIAAADIQNVCTGANASINVLSNDVGESENVSINKNTIDLNPSLSGIQKSFSITNIGVFTVDTAAVVKFVPVTGFTGTASASYTFQNSLGFTSNAAAITLTYSAPPTTPSAGPDQHLNNTTVQTSTRLEANGTGSNTGSWSTVTGPNAAVFSDPSSPNTNVLNLIGGRYVFRWTVTSAGGCSLFDDVQVTVTQPPVANDDAARTPFNTDVIIPVLANDTYTGTATLDKGKVVIKSQPQNGTVRISSAGEVIYTPKDGFKGTDTLTYTVADINGVISNIASVIVTVLAPPTEAPDIVVGTTSGKPIAVPVVLPAGGSINIIRAPANGTITFDPVTGLPIYTPNPNFSGQDNFTYTIIDADGNSSKNPGTVTVFVQRPAKLGLAKKLESQSKNTDGSYNLIYTFKLVNKGDVNVQKLSLTDDLSKTFPGCIVVVKRLNATGNLVVNPAYNGSSVTELLLSSSYLELTSEFLTLEINVVLTSQDGIFNNISIVKGVSELNGSDVSDISTDGANPDPFLVDDVTPSVPTPANLIKNPLFIPKGFSPNNDGINDFLIIENANGRQILLEVYNRWGNRIYRSKEYKNDWSGKTTEGIHVGDEVPVGTYYYVVVVDNKEKYVGYLTINR